MQFLEFSATLFILAGLFLAVRKLVLNQAQENMRRSNLALHPIACEMMEIEQATKSVVKKAKKRLFKNDGENTEFPVFEAQIYNASIPNLIYIENRNITTHIIKAYSALRNLNATFIDAGIPKSKSGKSFVFPNPEIYNFEFEISHVNACFLEALQESGAIPSYRPEIYKQLNPEEVD